jgi:hypothetical protein
MRLYSMTAQQLEAASKSLATIIEDVSAEHPEAAIVIGDAMQLVALESLARVVGDREAATALFRATHGGH